MAYKSKQRTFKKRENKEEFVARKQAEEQHAYDTIDSAITDIMQDDNKFKDYLDFQSHMERYAVSNTLLIFEQCPQATQLKSAETWNELDVKINKGAKAIHILEPTEYVDGNGEHRTAYNIKNVFDISQTNAEVKTQVSKHSTQSLVKAMINSTVLKKVAVDELPLDNSTAFFDDKNKTLMIKRHSDSFSLFQDISRELSLAEIASNSDDFIRDECLPSAICASYMLCNKYGVDKSNINVFNVKGEWANKENKDIRTMLTMANDSVYSIGKDIYIEMNKVKDQKEQESAR
jgi:hypothetical protein